MIELPPLPKLWVPAKPAIVRAASLKEVEATFPFPFLPAKSLYRYLRYNLTRVVGSSSSAAPMYQLFFSSDLGATNFPTVFMTGASAPSPLVASSAGDSANAWKVFDNGSTTFVQPTANFSGGLPDVAYWIQLDCGSGNGLSVVNAVKTAAFNSGGFDMTPMDFSVTGSMTGAFAGEQVTLFSKTGQTTKAHQTLSTYT